MESQSEQGCDETCRRRFLARNCESCHPGQTGSQACSTGHVTDVRQFLSRPDCLGKITAIAMQMHRNTPVNKPQWARPALLTPDLTPDLLDF